jgi:hypothetical protein
MAIQSKQPGELAARMAKNLSRARQGKGVARQADGWRRETFNLPREKAREKAREWFGLYPKAAYMTEIESWRELPDGCIEFTMRRLPSAD